MQRTLLAALALVSLCDAGRAADVPAEFPRFAVPQQERSMDALRELFWQHYPGTGPKSTMWDAWLPMCGLWPATDDELQTNAMRQQWRQALLTRKLDPQGYVSTHQHSGLAHNDGWPFPLWTQAKGVGWHFMVADCPYRSDPSVVLTDSLADWRLTGIRDGGGNDGQGRSLELTEAGASLATPRFRLDAFVAPFIRLDWKTMGLPASARPYLEWTTEDEPKFSPQRRAYFQLLDECAGRGFSYIPTGQYPAWKGTITRLRLNFDNPPNTSVTLYTLITACDSRQNINNTRFIRGSYDYFVWTGDTTFLQQNMGHLRRALHFAIEEFGTRKNKCVVTPWQGHDGRSGLEIGPDGQKILHRGRGIGNNYWDLLPFGGKDCLATIYLYDALHCMATLEQKIAEHPEWNVPADSLRFDPADLRLHAQEIKQTAGKLFWNPATGRFVAAIDVDDKAHDYGFTFVNCEAIYYGFATESQARSIVDWISGERIVDGDTSQGDDIYHWRFGPRATTRRNVDYYVFSWTDPASIPFGNQVQDGGAVLGFAFHDMMARLATNGPDDAWRRLRATIDWYVDTRMVGDYRKYYRDPERGTLQGGGPPGGLGLDCEFFESALVPQVMLYGFLGFEPRPDGFALNPRLPDDWPSLAIDQIRFHDLVLQVKADRATIRVSFDERPSQPLVVSAPPGQWKASYLDDEENRVAPDQIMPVGESNRDIPLSSGDSRVLLLTQEKASM